MFSAVQRIVSLARIVALDGIRSHAVIGLLCLALACETGGLLFFGFFPRDIGRVSNDFIFSISFLAGLVFVFFHAVNVLAWKGDKRLIHTFLARPLSRAEYVLGMFAGLAALLILLNLLLAGAGYVVLLLIKGQVSTIYFPRFSSLGYLLAWLGLTGIEMALLAVVQFFSAAVRGSFTVLLLSISYYLTCSGLPVVREVAQQSAPEGPGGMASVLKLMTTVFPDFSRLDFKQVVVSADTLPWGEICKNGALIALYAGVVLWLACFIYGRKDLR